MKNLSTIILRTIGRSLLRGWSLFERAMREVVRGTAWLTVRVIYVMLPVTALVVILSLASHGYLWIENKVMSEAHAAYRQGVQYVAVNHGYQLPRIEHPEEPFTIESAIRREFVVNGLPSGLVPVFRALVRHESGDKADAVSSANAIGYAQVIPANARFCGLPSPALLFDPEHNIACGVRIFASALKSQKGDLVRALKEYNAGAGRIDQSAENREYVGKVFKELVKLEMGE